MAGQQFEYVFDDIGNRTSTKEGGDAAGASLRSATYSANLLNQYTNRTVPGTVDIIGIARPTATVSVNDQSTYRRHEYYQAAVSNNNTSAILYPSYTNRAVLSVDTNQVIGNLVIPKTPQSFWYDLDGSLLSDGVWTNFWDAENRMLGTENTVDVPSAGRAKETWTFDGEGRWVQRIVSTWSGSSYTPQYTNHFAWEGNVLIGLLGESSVVKASFLRGLDMSGTIQDAGGVGGVIAVNLQTNGAHFCAYDGNGNIMALVKASDGSTSGSYEYDPFGTTLRLTGSATKENPLRFSSQFTDDVTMTSKYLYRDYTMAQGKWVVRDGLNEIGFARPPLKKNERRANEVNLYGVLGNDPINLIDILGQYGRRPDCSGDICARAKALNLDKGDDGGVICCGGRIYPCVWGNSDTVNRTAQIIIEMCLRKHEETHVDDHFCGSCASISRPGSFKLGKSRLTEECHGWGVTYACLKDNLDQCLGDRRCGTEVLIYMDHARDMIRFYCRPRFFFR